MNLVNPAGLALAALAIPIIILYILKVRLRRVPVSTLMFWRKIFEEKKPRSIWQRLRHLISLLLQLAFLALLVFALTDPIFRWQQARARRLVLVVDNSASMNATDISPTRLDAAKAEARRLVDGLRLGDEMAIIAAGSDPRVATGFTDHQRTLHDALATITPTDSPTHVEAAVEIARRLASGTTKKQTTVVITDAAFDAATTLAKEADVALLTVGKATPNLGITRFQARRSLLDPIGYEILVELLNASDTPANFRLEIDLDEEPIDVIPLELKPGERVTRFFEKTAPQGGLLRARIDQTDTLAADNTAWAVLPKRETRELTLLTEGNLFLEKVFEAIPLVDLKVAKPANSAQVTDRIRVYHRVVPRELPAGPIIVIEPTESCDLWDVGEPISNPIVAKLEKDAPLLAHVRLDQVLLPEARRLTLKEGAKVLAETANGEPLYAQFDRPSGRVVVLSVNLDKSDLPLQTAFPIMMTNALSWITKSQGELREARATGDVAELELPGLPNTQSLRLRGPDQVARPLEARAGRVSVGPLDRCGVWTIESAPSSETARQPEFTTLEQVACNLASARETDIRPTPDVSPAPRNLAGGFGGRPIWFYLLAAAGLLTCVEWYLYQRRWID